MVDIFQEYLGICQTYVLLGNIPGIFQEYMISPDSRCNMTVILMIQMASGKHVQPNEDKAETKLVDGYSRKKFRVLPVKAH